MFIYPLYSSLQSSTVLYSSLQSGHFRAFFKRFSWPFFIFVAPFRGLLHLFTFPGNYSIIKNLPAVPLAPDGCHRPARGTRPCREQPERTANPVPPCKKIWRKTPPDGNTLPSRYLWPQTFFTSRPCANPPHRRLSFEVQFPAILTVSLGVAAIVACGWYNLAIQGGGVYAWGSNNCGQLGNGTMTGQPVTRAGQRIVCGRDRDRRRDCA